MLILLCFIIYIVYSLYFIYSFTYHSIIIFEITTRDLKYIHNLIDPFFSRRLKSTRMRLLKINFGFGIRTPKSIRLIFL